MIEDNENIEITNVVFVCNKNELHVDIFHIQYLTNEVRNKERNE